MEIMSVENVRKMQKIFEKYTTVTSSSVVLDLNSTPPSELQVMRVWHMSASDPTTSQCSVILILFEPKTEAASPELLEEVADTLGPLLRITRVKPKRKHGNNSVSHHSLLHCGSDSPG